MRMIVIPAFRKPGLYLGIGICMSLGLAAFKLARQAQPVVPQKSASLISTSVSVPLAPQTKGQSDLFAAQQQTSSSNSPQTTNTASPLLEDVERRGEPFQIGNQTYTAVSHYKRIKGKTDGDNEAITLLEIRDASGAIAYQESFSYSFDKGGFDDFCFASTKVLPGSMGNWLLVSSECLPDAPLSGGPWQILGVANNKLVPWGKPLTTQGKWLRFVPGNVSKIGAATSFGFDMIELKVWTGNFFVTLPVRIDFHDPKLEPGVRCFSATGRGLAESGCEVPVEANRDPAGDDTFVRLFPEPAEGGGTPSHLIIHKNSTVEFLAANVGIVFDDSDGSISLGVADDAWLKVRIDGKIGWIHTQEDFEAIGLHFSG
jgi:hypothetical protein